MSAGSGKQTRQVQQNEQNNNQKKPRKTATSAHQIGHDSLSNESEVVKSDMSVGKH